MRYEIKRGDTLSQIAQKFGQNYLKLASHNNIDNPDYIRAGQIIDIPTRDMEAQVQAVQQAEPEVVKQVEPTPPPKREPVPVEKTTSRKSNRSQAKQTKSQSLFKQPKQTSDDSQSYLLPTNVRQFVYDLFGGTETLTEKNISSEEKKSLTEAVQRATRQNKSSLEYADYNTQAEGESQYADVGGGGDAFNFLVKLFDPSYSMKTTVGQARIEKDEKGNTIIVDRYNFNDANDKFSFTGLVAGIKKAGFNPYAQLRNVGRQLGSGAGEGSEVRINLGKLSSKDIEKVETLI